MRRIRPVSSRGWCAAWLTCGAIVVVAVTACTGGKTPNSADTANTAGAQKGRPGSQTMTAIPCDIPSFITDSISITQFRDALKAAKTKACIKEWNDYQRLLVRCTNPATCPSEYGPHAYVMAADSLGRWTKPDSFVTRRNVAEIAINGEYSDLGLNHGINEVYLRYDPNASDKKKRWVVTMEPNLDSVKLEVARFEGEPCCTSPDAYPAVARWDYDNNYKNQLIGIKCGDGWCEIGRHVKLVNKHAGGKKRRVKGWFDEQRLAVRSGTGPLKPTDSVATIFAVDNLESYNKKEDFKEWTQVATITSPYEYPKLGITGVPGIEAEVYLKFLGDTTWSAQIVSIDKNGDAITSPAFQVKRIEHTDSDSIPGVARWGWDDNDETIWVRCANGCCQVVPPKVETSQFHSTKAVPRKCPDGKQCVDTTRPKPKADSARPKPKSAAN